MVSGQKARETLQEAVPDGVQAITLAHWGKKTATPRTEDAGLGGSTLPEGTVLEL